ncbi:hypothetical protein PV08_01683 [Exophiala spinifera]|uniref:Utp8 beta-propeller domain-containing protein n=1 Tax=Exophiala spinifera TaxID=91928 RepID=A0A0D2CC96_9EURO|nr:uncharacterized protein PV08_01683 [Exophiala spinifera]KIW21104.1 hypothetical protein PV08_01683 [Exophiala spinifera]
MTMEISAPHPLVRLPRVARPDAATHIGPVFTVRDGVKRRRKEICAAVDGNSLNIYEAQDGNILTSFPVPPNSSFSGPPCSVRVAVDDKLHRRSYCALKLQSLQIQLFESLDGEQQHVKSVRSPPLNGQEPVMLVDVLPHAGNQILIAQANGNLTIFSADLERRIARISLNTKEHPYLQVLAIQHLTSAEAEKSVLKQRTDLLREAKDNTSYITLAYSKAQPDDNDQRIFYGLWPVNTTEGGNLPQMTSVTPLFEHEIPRHGNAKERRCTFGQHASHLYVKCGATFSTYDLSKMIPATISTLDTAINGSFEIMAITPAFAICSFQESLRLYDLKYQSIRLQQDTTRTNLKRKRHRMTAEGQIGPVEFITYLSHSARVIGKRRHHLVAIDISLSAGSKELHAGSQLIQNIGLGVKLHDEAHRLGGNIPRLAIGSSGDNSVSSKSWSSVRKRLDELAQAGDATGFEEVFAADLRSGLLQSSLPPPMIDDLPATRLAIPDAKTNYILTKIFHIESTEGTPQDAPPDARLKIQLPSFKLIVWLSRLGLLSHIGVKRAVSSHSPGAAELVKLDSVAEALLEVDPSLKLLTECLEAGFSPYAEEQAAVAQALLSRALTVVADAAPASKSDATSHEDGGKQEMQIQTLETSTSDPTWLPPQLQTALVLSLNKLGAGSTKTITQSLRSLFSQRETLALVQFLRQQLFQGGHTRSFQSLPPIEARSKVSGMPLSAIINILSSCVDAIGPLGIIGALENEDFVGNIIPDLVTEITHATESLVDATELRGILRETLRYEESIRKHESAGGRLQVGGPAARLTQQPGKIVTLYSENTKEDDGFQLRGGLPLALRAENVISPYKVRKGGGQVLKRSAREMSMLKSMSKGQYSFERLVL